MLAANGITLERQAIANKLTEAAHLLDPEYAPKLITSGPWIRFYFAEFSPLTPIVTTLQTLFPAAHL
jgi:hypothetical protein